MRFCKRVIIKYRPGLLLCALYIALSNAAFGSVCLSKALLGLPCPFCGMTRAALALARLDFSTAFDYNPMVFAVLSLLALYFLFAAFNRKWIKYLFYPAIAAVIASVFVFGFKLTRSFGVEPLVINKSALLFKILGV